MVNFFEALDPEVATEIEQLSQLIHELRTNRGAILKLYDTDDESSLLELIQQEAVHEHPAYEHYLAARVLGDTLEAVRSAVSERLLAENRQ